MKDGVRQDPYHVDSNKWYNRKLIALIYPLVKFSFLVTLKILRVKRNTLYVEPIYIFYNSN